MDESKRQRLIEVINNDPLEPRVLWDNKLLVANGPNYKLLNRREVFINESIGYIATTPVPQLLEFIGVKNNAKKLVNILKRIL
jgi:hypothetical protein